jgi:hypothetical protein
MRKSLSLVVVAACIGPLGFARDFAYGAGTQRQGPALPAPTFHHIHMNSVNPGRSIAWYEQYWPQGHKTTLAGFPAFRDGIYLLYTRVSKQAAGAFDRDSQRSIPQSAFWTFGSVFPAPNTVAFRDRIGKLDRKDFQLVTLYGGPDGKHTATHSEGLPMGGRLMTSTALKEGGLGANPAREPVVDAPDFAYLVDPDGMLVEVIAGATADFSAHTHFWGERPLCSANWHVQHLGATFPSNRGSNFSAGFTFTDKWEPCDVPIGTATYPTFIAQGQLRIPSGSVRIANKGWSWYPRQCRSGRCGPGNDQPLVRSRGQVVDHIGLTYPDLDAVIAHLKRTNVPIIEGPYRFGDTRAILVEDLDGLAFELIDGKNGIGR